MKLNILFFCFLVYTFTAINTYPQIKWVQTNGPVGGTIYDQLYFNSTLYISTNKGIFKSTDSGISFNKWGLQNKYITAIGTDSVYIYSGSIFKELFRKKIDSGEWEQLNRPSYSRITSIKYHPSGLILVGTFQDGMFGSLDQGLTWKTIGDGVLPDNIGDILVSDSSDIFICADDDGIYKSTDAGSTWIKKSQGLAYQKVNKLMEAADGKLFAGLLLRVSTGSGGIYRSTNRGESWIFQNYSYENIQMLHRSLNNIFAGGSNGFYRSTNSGEEWIKIGAGLGRPSFISMGSDLSGNVFVGSFEGIYKSENQGINFNKVGLPVMPVFSLITSLTGNIYAGTDFGIHQSSDFGNSWFEIPTVTQSNIFSLMKTGNNTVLAGLLHFGIFRQDSSGSWSWALPEIQTIRDIKQSGNGLIYAVGEANLFKSSNDGKNWTSLNVNIPSGQFKTVVTDESNLFIGTQGGGVYKSSDAGYSWTECNEGLGNLNINYLMSYTADKILAGSDEGVYLYSNGKWEDINSTFTSRKINYLFNEDDIIYAASDSGIYYYYFKEAEWSILNEGLLDMNVLSLTVDRLGFLVAGTMSGSVYRIHSPVPSSVQQLNDPKEFALLQNYPNPFNPTTKIKFSVPKNEFVTLKIFDILGNEIAQLVNEEKPAGEYQVQWDASNFSSGVYFYSLQAGEFIATKKLLLMK